MSVYNSFAVGVLEPALIMPFHVFLQGHDDFVFSEDSYTVSPIQGITGISVAFSFDGKQLATGSDDCTSRIWDVHSGQCKMTLRVSLKC